MKGIILSVAILMTGLGLAGGQLTPANLVCDPFAIVDWITDYASSGSYWEGILINREFTTMCSNIDLWLTNIGGCLDGVISFIEVTFGVEIMQELADIYSVMAVVQFYCDNAPLTQVCDWNAIAGCATATLLTFQETIVGTIEEIGTVCESYNAVLDTMNYCVENAISDCTDDEQQAVMASYDMVFSYFQVVADYCGTSCGNFILLAASQLQNCDYVNIDWNSLEFSEYCTYTQTVLDCIWQVYSVCPIATPEQTSLGMTGIITYGSVIGCTLNVGGVVTSDLDQDMVDVVLPPCAASSIECAQTIASVLGVTNTAGPNGGYDYQGVVAQANSYFDMMTSGQIGDICILVEDTVWSTVSSCTDGIVTDCPVDATSGETAMMLISTEIAGYIEMACSEECQAIQTTIENYLDCTAPLRTTTPDLLETSVEVLTGLFSTGGGDIEICQIAQGYVDCVLPAIQGCSVLYDNYVDLVTMYSTVDYVISVCNIELDLGTGEVNIVDENRPLIYWSGANEIQTSFVVLLAGLLWALLH